MLFLAGVALAQDSGQDPKSSTNGTNLSKEVETLREALSQTQKQLGEQQREIEALKTLLKVPAGAPDSKKDPPNQIDAGTRDEASSRIGPTSIICGH